MRITSAYATGNEAYLAAIEELERITERRRRERYQTALEEIASGRLTAKAAVDLARDALR